MVKVTALDNNSDFLLSLAGSLESRSEHPIARAFSQFSDETASVGDFLNHPGQGITGTVDGVEFQVTRGVTRPVWRPDTEGTAKIFEVAKDIARELGFEMTGRSQGGGSDGNFTGALGIPTLDSIGVRGAGLHTLGEYIETDSLVERAQLMAGLLTRLT